MPTWRCPHCSTPQAESARCWVCGRSSTSCSSCANYRRAVAVNVGFCSLDPDRRPLGGDEIRPCWEANPVAPEAIGLFEGLDTRPAPGAIHPSPRAVARADRVDEERPPRDPFASWITRA
jgi:hypothetical protein